MMDSGLASGPGRLVGRSVARQEDDRLLRGGGRYTDDVSLPGQAVGYFLRSPHAHGIIRRLDVAAVPGVPEVVACVTAADLKAAGYGPLPCKLALKSHDGTPLIVPERPLLAADRVRFVGEPIALVVAESLSAAKDGAEAIILDVEPLPGVSDVSEAVRDGAPQLFDEVPGNVCLDWRSGDFAAIDAALAGAAHVTRLDMVNNRVSAVSMEPRAATAAHDAASGRFTLRLGCQGVFGLRNTLADDILHIPRESLQVVAEDVGGSFGMKGGVYPEYAVLLHVARALGRPVRWTDERTDSFIADYQARDAKVTGELGLDGDGRIVALRITGLANVGGYVSGFGAAITTVNIVKNAASLYTTPLLGVQTKCVVTNTVPISAYRGAGRPEGNYYVERLLDAAARATGRDPAALRRSNLIPASAMPYKAVSGLTYDSGDFAAVLDDCLARADWAGFAARRAATARDGLLRGIGLACYLEVTAPPGKEMGGIRFEPGGEVSIVTGTLDYGQGHASTFAQVLADKLGIPFARIRLCQGDSDTLLHGGGTGGSRSIMASGTAIALAADMVIARGRQLAGHVLEAAAADIEFDDGAFRVVGTDKAIAVLDLAGAVRDGADLPADLPQSLDAALVADTPPSAFPNGCHVAEVVVDPETGVVTVARYVAVDDFGTLINPMVVEGQVHGGVAQGIGQALMEWTLYGDDGTPLSASMLDYAMPRADHMPPFVFASHPVPATSNVLGVKGCGEAGTTGALPAIVNAVVDALSGHGVTHIDMPATPERVWRALQQRGG